MKRSIGMLPRPSTMRRLILLSLLAATSVTAQHRSAGALWPELVIPVDQAEARRLIESNPAAELVYEKFVWLSKGRIRVAKIDGDVLALVDQAVQFTAFDGAEPIIVMSHGIDGHKWRASRIKGRFDPDAHGGIEAAVLENPEADPVVVKQLLEQLLTEQNEVTWRVGTALQDPISGEYLLRNEDLDKFVINPRTGEYRNIDSPERSARWLAEKDGLIAPCPAEVKAAQYRREAAVRSGLPKPMPPPLPSGAVPSAKVGAAASASFSTVEPAGCEDLGDLSELVAALSPERAAQWRHGRHGEFKRGKPVPPNAVTSASAGGSIATDGTGPFNKAAPTNAHQYVIMMLANNPAYVVIYEPSRRWPPIPIDDLRSQAERDAWERSPEMVAYRKTEDYRLKKENKESLAAHMAKAQARISARAPGERR
jgi:hypothetical protein